MAEQKEKSMRAGEGSVEATHIPTAPTAGGRRAVNSYEVEFTFGVGPKQRVWRERINRPINEAAILRVVHGLGVSKAKPENLSAPYEHDYSGQIFAAMRPIGAYVIVPSSGSEVVVAEREKGSK